MMTVIPSVSALLALVERMPRPLVWTAAAHGALALVCLLAWRLEAPPILGVHPAVKPLKFAVSIAVFLATMGVLIPRLSTTAAVRDALAWALAVTMIVEVVPIVAQSLRGTTSHFNHTSPLDRAVWGVMVLAIVAATAAMIVIALLATSRPLVGADGGSLSTWAWRLGLWLLLLAPVTGFLMGGRLRHSVGGADGGPGLPLLGWSVLHGDLRVAHFFALHALQLLPLLAWGLERAVSAAWARWALWSSVALAMSALCVGTLVQAWSGRPFAPRRVIVAVLSSLGLSIGMSLGAVGCVSARDFGFYEPAVVGLPPDDASADLSAVWVGHATVLLRLGDQHVLTDPNLSGALFILPRHTPASLKPAELPPIDVAVVSHLHFDHYDLPTLSRLPSEVPVVFPRDSARYTTELGRRKVALEPWTSVRTRHVRVTAVPVAHFGGRYGLDAWWNQSYTGYVIEGHGRTVFFAGDTGYDPELFREVGRRFPRIDLALIPIGPFRNDRGSAVHTDPAEALQIFEDVRAEHMVPIHFEAYYGPYGGFDAPREKLTRLVAERNLGARVHVLRTGERWVAPWVGGGPRRRSVR